MVVVRGLGWLLLAMAVAAIVHDGLTWWSDGSFHLLGLGDLWSRLDMRSLGDTQSAVQRHLSGALWSWVVRPVLMIPALPAFLALGVLLIGLAIAAAAPAFSRWAFLRPRPSAPPTVCDRAVVTLDIIQVLLI